MSNDSLTNLINKIKAAKEESVKAVAYSEGYLDCIKDMLNDSENDINKIISVKYDGNVRNEVYTEVLSVLRLLQSKNISETSKVSEVIVADKSVAIHPSDKAKSFLERIGR